MLRGLRVAVLGVTIVVAGPAAAEGPDWPGTYTYTERGGRTAGGTGIVVGHQIVVTREGGRYKAEITASGYQTSVQVFAIGEAAGAKLALRFARDGEDQTFKNQYQPGALLLELERASGGRLLTHWRALTPATRERFANPGVYFKRQ
ncbi:MAG TPA: DUF5991 domain-containing protein [Alphaproteobacteria bacterium]|jgi:hypothetical protein